MLSLIKRLLARRTPDEILADQMRAFLSTDILDDADMEQTFNALERHAWSGPVEPAQRRRVWAMLEARGQSNDRWLVIRPMRFDPSRASRLHEQGPEDYRLTLELQEARRRMDQIQNIRISHALLYGRVHDAEEIAQHLTDPEEGFARIAEWKKRYAGMPHGQWDGVLEEQDYETTTSTTPPE